MSRSPRASASSDLLVRLDERYQAIEKHLTAMLESNTLAIHALAATSERLERSVALLEQRMSHNETKSADRERDVDQRLHELKEADRQNADEHKEFAKALEGLNKLISKAQGGFSVAVWIISILVTVMIGLLLYFVTQFQHIPKP